jgi:hypothetical protein
MDAFSSDMVIDLGGSNVVITGSGNTLTQQSFIADPLETGGDAQVNIDKISLGRYNNGVQVLEGANDIRTWENVAMGKRGEWNSVEKLGIYGWVNPFQRSLVGKHNA